MKATTDSEVLNSIFNKTELNKYFRIFTLGYYNDNTTFNRIEQLSAIKTNNRAEIRPNVGWLQTSDMKTDNQLKIKEPSSINFVSFCGLSRKKFSSTFRKKSDNTVKICYEEGIYQKQKI